MKTGCKVCYILSIVYNIIFSLFFLFFTIIFSNVNIQSLVDKGIIAIPQDIPIESIQFIFQVLSVISIIMLVIFLIDCAFSILLLIKSNSSYFDSDKVLLPTLSLILGFFGNVPFLVGGILWLIHIFAKDKKNKIS